MQERKKNWSSCAYKIKWAFVFNPKERRRKKTGWTNIILRFNIKMKRASQEKEKKTANHIKVFGFYRTVATSLWSFVWLV